MYRTPIKPVPIPRRYRLMDRDKTLFIVLLIMAVSALIVVFGLGGISTKYTFAVSAQKHEPVELWGKRYYLVEAKQ